MKLKPKGRAKKKSIDELILEGINITRMAQEGNALYSTNKFIAVDAHNRYDSWIIDIKEFFERNELNDIKNNHFSLVEIFYLGDSVPLPKAGPEYVDPASERSQILLKNIRVEATKKFELLRKLKDEMFAKHLSKSNKEMASPSWVPANLKWEKVTLKVKEGLQDIEIHYDGKHIKTADYIELGFSASKKNCKPNMKWRLLIILSVLQSIDKTKATVDGLLPMLAEYSKHKTDRSNIHQTKKALSDALMTIFNTDENPFVNNRVFYEPKFIILPEPTLRDQAIWRQGGHLQENVDHGSSE